MLRLFIVAGQSNASGRGAAPYPTYANADRIFMLGNDDVWKQAYEPTDDATGQIDSTSDDGAMAGAGFAMSFANRICELFPDDLVGLIPCAKGSTAIKQWRRMPTRKNLYGSMIARAEKAKVETGGTLSGILWWQGESDAETEGTASGHREAFGNLVSDMRVDLCDLTMPVAFARLNNLNPSGKPYWNTIRSMQNQIYIPRCVMVSTDGVPYDSSNVHATTAGYQTVGVRFADAIAPLL